MFDLTVFLTIICFVSIAKGAEGTCSFPPPAANFQNSAYEGRWIEIGKIQTKGGAFFERNCVCTEINIDITDEKTGEGIADNDCRYKEVDGKWTNVTGALYNEDLNEPGRWLEQIGGGSPVNYTVIAISDDYSVEYDCGTSHGITNYCIHVMSRTQTMDEATFNSLIKMAEDMGLNPQNLPVTITEQEGCV